MTPTQPTPEEQVEALEAIAGDVSMGTRWVATTAEANVNTLLAAASLLRALLTQQSQERAENTALREALVGLMAGLYVDIEAGDLHGKDDWIPRWVKAVDALSASPGKGAEGEA